MKKPTNKSQAVLYLLLLAALALPAAAQESEGLVGPGGVYPAAAPPRWRAARNQTARAGRLCSALQQVGGG